MAESALTVRAVAAYLNPDEKTVYRLALKRVILDLQVAGAWRFRPEDNDRWIASHAADALAGVEPVPAGRTKAWPQGPGHKRMNR